jgi:phosphatidate cytidylyltransferase
MLRWRLLLGTVFIAALIGLCWVDHLVTPPGVVLLPLALALCVLGSHEYLGLLAARSGSTAAQQPDRQPIAPLVYVGSLAVVLVNAIPVFWPTSLGALGWPLAAFGLAVLAAFVGEMHRYDRPGGVMERLGLTVLGIAYCGLLLAFVVQMRLLGPEGRIGGWGVAAIASLVIVVKMCDIGAYTFGRLLGRHKMTPVLSPGKTWEGAAGGLAFACLGSWAALNWLAPAMTGLPPRPMWCWLGYGVIVGIAGILGDLAESLIKRDVGRKDSSTWMPGFGGVLDLLDSVLFAAPVAFLCWKLA